ncbi:NACHT domain-containing NTPase [Chryseobacterium sp.]|uniref:NACHT domain-containing protein n=1 Tax=Chryseobacterium sp. TaxID=1871047 RepID=UPI0012C0A080|nr:NACHT domain-containing protein [Chryseobacterium sp.]MPS64297.1 NACHT domain-containing protein [Chryseobacterium sp.]
MEANLELKDIITIASPIIKSFVDNIITPKLDILRKKLEKKGKLKSFSQIPFEKYFSEYYHRSFKKMSIINTLTFNNSQKLLDDIYIPLTIRNSHNYKEIYKIKEFPKALSNEYWNILITDTAGMGKSTLMKKMFLSALNSNNGIPLFIELRRLSKNKSILEELKEQLNSVNNSINDDILFELLNDGEFIIMLDGYDEISLNDKDIVTSDIQNFISKTSKNKYFITSRPEKSLASFGNFQEFRITSLTKKEAFELLRKYDNRGTISTLLIKKLQESDLSNINEFLTNPLLVSLLFTAFEYKNAIPFKKHLFYRQVYDANFESHDLTKGDSYIHNKYSKLEIDDFHRVLRHIGFMSLKDQKIEYTKDELLKFIDDSKNFCTGLSFNNSDFLNDLLKTVPLFSQDGNYYRWTHKSLQEYFAAQFIYLDAKSRQENILKKLYKSPNLEKYINVLDLYYDMDFKTFRNIIIYDLAKEYNEYVKNNYIQKYNDVDPEDIILRKELLFLRKFYLFKGEKEVPDEKLDEILNKIESIENVNGFHIDSIFVESPVSENYFGILMDHSKLNLLDLLFQKNNIIIKKISATEADIPNPMLDKNLQNYLPLELNDDSSNILNSKENFNILNQFIKYFMLPSYIVSNTEIIKVYEEIENSVKIENNIDGILDEL